MQLTSGCFGRDKREDGGEGHWRLAREEGVRDKWMMWQQLNYFGSKFWELLEERVFFHPNNFWQGLKTSFLGLQFLDTLEDALIDALPAGAEDGGGGGCRQRWAGGSRSPEGEDDLGAI